MGNMQQRQPKQEESTCTAGSSTLDKELLFRFLGLRMANEGDGYELPVASAAAAAAALSQEKETNSDGAKRTWRNMGASALSAVGQHHGQLHNPGTVADLHDRCHDMMPQTFDGFRLNISRCLTPHVNVAHGLQLTNKSGNMDCRFSTSYTLEAASRDPLIVAEMDAKGNLNGSMMHFLTQRLRGKVMASFVASQLHTTRLLLDYFGRDYTCSCCVLGNFKLADQMGLIVASYLQQVTPHLALGMQLIYQREDIIPGRGGQASMLSAVARYQRDNRIWSAIVNMHSLEICFTQLYGPSLGASVQLQANVLKRLAISRLCYHCHLPQIGFNFRGGVDTRGVISAVCERQLEPWPVLLQLSAKLNHLNNRFRFGIGMVID